MFDRVSEVLPLATKPIRYTGGEYNALSRDPDPSRVSWVLGMPEVYEIGMSNYGLRVLYAILNRLQNASCERCYVPWPDFGPLLAARGLPLYALESKRPVREFDVVGLSLQSELSHTNVPCFLELAGIPLRRDDRSADDPLVVAGGPCTLNPLPLERFFDAFVVGDGEDAVRDITAAYQSWDGRAREDLLAALARLPGTYVPGRTGRVPGAVKRRVVAELREEDFPSPPVVPICEITHDRLAIEISRGCTRGCRFCQAGMTGRPVRFRPVDDIIRIAERGVRATGWEEVSLLSLSALDYPDIRHLVQRITARLEERRVSVSLPSTRGEDFSPELAFDLQAVKKAGLTFAPETVAPRLKSYINKHIPESATLESIRTALDAGWHGVKLYFMVGLPTETDADVDEIARFVDEIARLCRGSVVRCSVNPFVPKPHTPLQWSGFAGIEAARAKIDRLRARLVRRNVRLKWENPESSFVQAFLARGDERVGPVVERVYRQGGLFQEWTEQFRLDRWLDACQAEGVDPAGYTAPRPVDEPLAWDVIDAGVSPGFLKREYERASRGEATPDCARAECSGCGVCPGREPPPRPAVTPPEVASYGRRRRTAARVEEPKTRFRLKYAVEGAYRFAAHLDRVRAFYRALRRSELPVLYTHGFAPKPMLSFGPPLPVGLESEGEYLDFFTSVRYAGNVGHDLGHFLPRGLRLVAARVVPAHLPKLGKAINVGRYRVDLDPDRDGGRDALAGRGRMVPGVRRLEVDGSGLLLDLAIAPGIRLFEVLSRILGIEGDGVRQLDARRLELLVEESGRVVTPMED